MNYPIMLILVSLGVLSRTIFHLGPNVEFVTAGIILASYYLDRRGAVIVAFSTLFISDAILGNTSIFIFTWSAYLGIAVVASLLLKNRRKKTNLLHLPFKSGIFALASSLWFYLWTNFGVWLLDSFGMYEKTFSGLINAYIMGIPFLKYNLIGNLIFVPGSFFLVEFARQILFENSRYKWYRKLFRL